MPRLGNRGIRLGRKIARSTDRRGLGLGVTSRVRRVQVISRLSLARPYLCEGQVAGRVVWFTDPVGRRSIALFAMPAATIPVLTTGRPHKGNAPVCERPGHWDRDALFESTNGTQPKVADGRSPGKLKLTNVNDKRPNILRDNAY
jgi:hypothetical protein